MRQVRASSTILAALLLSLTLLASAGAGADAKAITSGEPSRFIERLGNDAVGMIANETLSQEKKTEEFRRLLKQGFALRAIGRFALGRYWKSAKPEQRQRYQALFEEYIVATYAARFSEYGGETLRILGEDLEGQTGANVRSSIIRPEAPDQPIIVIWRIRSHKGQLKIVDVVIENVSMSMTQRSDFAAVIRQNGGNIDAFLDSLQAVTEKASGAQDG